jgi:adenine phosphoribosyltransferase
MGEMEQIRQYIRSVPDFPKPGINFYDITTLFQNPVGFRLALDGMEAYIRSRKADKIVAIEARGFILGAALADRLQISLVPARKPGKLPWRTITEEYSLEYGTDRLQMHADAVSKGDRVVIVDDLIATGGTITAACNLVEKLGGQVAGISAVIGLPFLPFKERLAKYDVHCLISFDSE